MDRNGPRLNRTGNGIEYLISLNILWSVTFLLPVGSDALCNTLLAYLVEALYDMCHVKPRTTISVHLMKHVITKQLEQVPITRLRPRRIHVVPAHTHSSPVSHVTHLSITHAVKQ